MTAQTNLTRRLARYRAARETPMSDSKRRQLDALIRETERRLAEVTPIACWEDLDGIAWLSDADKAAIWDAFFEYDPADDAPV